MRGRPKGVVKTPGSGRRSGTPNRNRFLPYQKMEELNFEPITELVKLIQKPLAIKRVKGKIVFEGLSDGEKADKILQLMEYLHPKLRSVEQKIEAEIIPGHHERVEELHEHFKKMLLDQPCNGLISLSPSQDLSLEPASSMELSEPKSNSLNGISQK